MPPSAAPGPRTRVGLAGVGRMGLPICANLVRAGFDVTAADTRPGREEAVIACGARWAGTAAEAAAGADVLITVLPGTPELRAAMLGPGDILGALARGGCWIDMTSAAPAAGRELAAAAAAAGVAMLEAPVGGGVRAAVTGTLQVFAGGDAGVLERQRDLLGALADPGRISYLGGPGAGYTGKLLANLLWFGQAVATAEALLLARRQGIALRPLLRALAGSAAASAFLHGDVDALLHGDYLASFGLDRCCEELSAITAVARASGVPFELSDLVATIYRRALERFGPADGELLPVAMLEEQAGLLLRDPD